MIHLLTGRKGPQGSSVPLPKSRERLDLRWFRIGK